MDQILITIRIDDYFKIKYLLRDSFFLKKIMHIYVINLNRSVQRLSRIKEQLENLNLPFIRIEAIDGNQLALDKSRVNSLKFHLSQERKCEKNELGCAESHRKVWNQILKNGDQYALILEDDVILPKDTNEFLKLMEADPKLDIVNLSSSGSYALSPEKLMFLKNNQLYKRPYFKMRSSWKAIECGSWKIFSFTQVKDSFICECSVWPPLMSAYIVSQKACRELLKASEELTCPIDYKPRKVKNPIRQGFCYPPYIIQNNSLESTIGKRNEKIQVPLWVKFSRIFYKLRNFRRKFNLFHLYGLKSLF